MQYHENTERLLNDINFQLEKEKYQHNLSQDNATEKFDQTTMLDEKIQLEYLKELLLDDNIRRLSCHISDYNHYNNFRFKHTSSLIVSDADLEKITKSKQIYINQHQLFEYFGLNLNTQSKFRNEPKHSPNYLPHYKISSKTILYKLSDIEQWIEERGFGTSDYIIN